MKQGYITNAAGQQFHYRSVGDGPPLILLHASPQSSEAVMPAANVFAKHCHCIAMDTLGYGLSDDLGIENPTITDYAESFISAFEAIGLQEFCLYGTATGSQIAIEIAKRYPEKVRFLMLDSNGHVDDSDIDQILEGYFPSVSPQIGGGHLLTYWEMCRSLYTAFPWTSGKVEDGFEIMLPPASVMQGALLRYLQAGEGYHLAYRTAFHIEKREHMDGLDVPTIMTRWARSPVLTIADELIALGLPDCVEVLDSDGDIMDRFRVQAQALGQYLETQDLEPFDFPEKSGPDRQGLNSVFFGDEGKQLHAKVSLSGEGVAVLCLHDACRSSDQFIHHIQDLIGTHPLIIPDLPGHGASTDCALDPSLTDMISVIISALKDLSIEQIIIIGAGLGVSLGAALSNMVDVKALIAIDLPFLSDAERLDYIENGIIDITPHHDGTHLVRAWSMLKAQELYKLWYKPDGREREGLPDANLSPDYLHQSTVELLRTGERYPDFMRLKLEQDWREAIKNINVPVTITSLSDLVGALD